MSSPTTVSADWDRDLDAEMEEAVRFASERGPVSIAEAVDHLLRDAGDPAIAEYRILVDYAIVALSMKHILVAEGAPAGDVRDILQALRESIRQRRPGVSCWLEQ